MYSFLFFIHIIAVAMGLGGGLANILARRQMKNADPVTYPAFALVGAAIGKMATSGLLLLWISGVWMSSIRYDGIADIPVLLWMKIIVVLAMTAISAMLNIMIIKSQRSGTPPDAERLSRLSHSISGLAVLTVLIAVWIFH